MRTLAVVRRGCLVVAIVCALTTFSTHLTNFVTMETGGILSSGSIVFFLVLSPESGCLKAIGTKSYIRPCFPRGHRVGPEDLRLMLPNHGPPSDTKGPHGLVASEVVDMSLQAGNLIVATFDIGVELWEEIRRSSSSGRQSVGVVFDKITGASMSLPILSDPILTADTDDADRPFLAATTTIRKSRDYYTGYDRWSGNSSKVQEWSVDESTLRLNDWLRFHRSLGVQHFYVLDNEPLRGRPDLMMDRSHNVTYIRTGIPYDFPTCNGRYFFPGQVLLENAVIALSGATWLLVSDVDEFVVPSVRWNRSLANLLSYYSTTEASCSAAESLPDERMNNRTRVGGESANVPCEKNGKENDTRSACEVYSVELSPVIVFERNRTRPFHFTPYSIDRWDMVGSHAGAPFKKKVIVRPNLTQSLSVHYASAKDPSNTHPVVVPMDHGWLAHFHKRHRKDDGVGGRVEDLRLALSIKSKE